MPSFPFNTEQFLQLLRYGVSFNPLPLTFVVLKFGKINKQRGHPLRLPVENDAVIGSIYAVSVTETCEIFTPWPEITKVSIQLRVQRPYAISLRQL